MGNSLSSSSAYDAAEETKDEINRRCDSYVAFAELTESLVDIELDDLREEIASVIEAFLPNVVSLSSKESSSLIENVERYANNQKYAISAMFNAMAEAQDEFNALAVDISEDYDEVYSKLFDGIEDDSDVENDDEEIDDNEDNASDDIDIDDNQSIEDLEFGENEDADDGDEYVHYEPDEEADNDELFYADEDDGSIDENNSDFDEEDEDEDEDIPNDTDVLQAMRHAIDPIILDYHNELDISDLEEDVINRRTEELRRILVTMAGQTLKAAIKTCVSRRYSMIVSEIDYTMKMGFVSGMFSKVDSSREVLESVTEFASLGRDRLRQLPFEMDEPVADAVASLEDYVEKLINDTAMRFTNEEDCADAHDQLMTIEMDEDYDDDYFTMEELQEIDRNIAMIEDEKMEEIEDSDSDSDNDDDDKDTDDDDEEEDVPAPKGRGKGKSKATTSKKSPVKKASTKAKPPTKGRGKKAAEPVVEEEEEEEEEEEPVTKGRGKGRGKTTTTAQSKTTTKTAAKEKSPVKRKRGAAAAKETTPAKRSTRSRR